MPRLIHLTALVAVLLFAGACTRDAVREMGSLKDTELRPAHRTADLAHERSVKAAGASAEIEREDEADAIETGSIDTQDCQGEHIAYQATKEYLKNFGPRPPDQPGERGPCRRNAPER